MLLFWLKNNADVFTGGYLNSVYLKVKMDQLLQRNIVRLSAVVPAALTFDDGQIENYGTIEEFDKSFESDEVGDDYIKRINTEVIDAICNFVRANQQKELKKFEAKTDAIRITVVMDWEEIILEEICVRPCLQGRKLCTALIYQLYKLARHWNNKLMIQSCTLSMQDTLARRFGMMAEPNKDYEDPTMADCVLENINSIKRQVTASDLGLTGVVQEEGHFLARLKPAAFETAEALRDQAYIDDTFEAVLNERNQEAPTKKSKKAKH